MSSLGTINTSSSGEFHLPIINKSKGKFSSKYDKLLKQISEAAKRNKDDTNVEKEHLKTFSSNISTRKENPLKEEIFKAKLSFLTGKTLDSINYTTRKSNAKEKKDNLFADSSINRENTFREMKNFLKKKGEISFQSKLFKENAKKDSVYSYSKSNNTLVSKLKQTFPEYINIKTKGKSFIDSSSTSSQKLNQLRNQLNKI